MIAAVLFAAAGSAFTSAWHYAHARARASAHARETCEHPPEAQETMRVNSIITMNPALIHRVIPGRRHLKKSCRNCGEQWHMYAPTLQPFDDFVREFDQETIDRAAQLQARTQAHIREKAHAEAERLRKRG